MATIPLTHLFSFFTASKPPPAAAPPRYPVKTVPSNVSTATSVANAAWEPLVLTNEEQAPPRDVMSVVCPSLAHANTMFFRSAYNVQVVVDDNEPEEKLLGRFRREVMRAGVIQECKRRRFFETKQDEKKRKTREAAKRNRRRRPPPRTGGPWDKQEASKSKKEDEDEDNWDLPEGNLPY